MTRLLRRLPVVFLLSTLAAALGAAGCDSYHYYDMTLEFGSGWTGGINSAGAAQSCKVTVSGADSHSFSIDNCGINNASNYPDTGIFEFATFADSGNLTFTVDAYNGTTPATCLFGMGTLSIPATSQVTTTGTIMINPDGTGCPQ
ncbi:MAG TPA: hypothetical protein VFG23_13110 [Polyangia bacterium]|nr:hypothetical protein [Polyangia bacterium]